MASLLRPKGVSVDDTTKLSVHRDKSPCRSSLKLSYRYLTTNLVVSLVETMSGRPPTDGSSSANVRRCHMKRTARNNSSIFLCKYQVEKNGANRSGLSASLKKQATNEGAKEAAARFVPMAPV